MRASEVDMAPERARRGRKAARADRCYMQDDIEDFYYAIRGPTVLSEFKLRGSQNYAWGIV